MAILISNCADTNSLSAAFSKAEKYAVDKNFKLQKSKDDILKLMAACAAQKPPDRPEVKFEDAGKTITVTVGKSRKTMLVLATKVQSPDISKLAEDVKRDLVGSREGAVGGIEVLVEQEKKLGSNPQALKKYWETAIPRVGDQIKALERAIQSGRKRVETAEALVRNSPSSAADRILADAWKVVEEATKSHKKADMDIKKVHERFRKLPK